MSEQQAKHDAAAATPPPREERDANAPEHSGADGQSSTGDERHLPERERSTPDTPLTLGDHLEELRSVLIRSILALILGILLCFAIFGDNLFGVFVAPLEMDSIVLGHPPRIPAASLNEDGTPTHLLVTIDVLERFKVLIFVAIIGGIFFAGPYILWQIWSFVRIGLYPRERRVVYVLLPGSALLFAGGVAFGYFLMLPVVVDFMLNLGGEQFDQALRTELRLTNYLTYFVVMTLFVGLIFQIPVVMTVVARITDVNPARLRGMRRYVVVIALVIGMLMTPPDPITQVMLAIPVLLLFELGLTCADWAHRARMREHEAIMAEPDPWEQLWNEQGAETDTASNERRDRNGGSGDGDGHGGSVGGERGGGPGEDGGPDGGGAGPAGDTVGGASGSATQAAEERAHDAAPATGSPLHAAQAHAAAPPDKEAPSADAEHKDAAADEEIFSSGPVARSRGFVTWRQPSPPATSPDVDAEIEDSSADTPTVPSDDTSAADRPHISAAGLADTEHESERPRVAEQRAPSPFARDTAPLHHDMAEPKSEEERPRGDAEPRPLEEGDILALIDMRLEHYLREELPQLVREWIVEELRRRRDE